MNHPNAGIYGVDVSRTPAGAWRVTVTGLGGRLIIDDYVQTLNPADPRLADCIRWLSQRSGCPPRVIRAAVWDASHVRAAA